MLAKVAAELPREGGYLFEPKWDGFRAIVFRDAKGVFIQSRDLRPLDRYFPDLNDVLLDRLPAGSVVDGEIVIAGPRGLDFDALQMRLHPAASRVARLAKETPASFIAFDLLAAAGKSLMQAPLEERRARLEKLLAKARAPLHLTPATRDRKTAQKWLAQFEGAGLDGVIAKPTGLPYLPGQRAMLKVKHVRTADCAVIGFRWHKSGKDAVGSLLLGLYDEAGELHHAGVASAFKMAERRALASELKPLRLKGGPRLESESSRWSAGKDLSWEPLRIERVCEVKYDHLQGDRFRHAALFLRWRPDKRPADCRYDQLEAATPFALDKVLRAGT
jgi:ATP-dependent DNA ligase